MANRNYERLPRDERVGTGPLLHFLPPRHGEDRVVEKSSHLFGLILSHDVT